VVAATIPIVIMVKTNETNRINQNEQIRVSILPFLTINSENSLDNIHEMIEIPNKFNDDNISFTTKTYLSLVNKSKNPIRDIFIKDIKYFYKIDNNDEIFVDEEKKIETNYKIAIAEFGKVFLVFNDIKTLIRNSKFSGLEKTQYTFKQKLCFRIDFSIEFKDLLYNSYEQSFMYQKNLMINNDTPDAEIEYYITSDCSLKE
jgi:hypothetical protein